MKVQDLLGEILVREGILSPALLRQARAHQAELRQAGAPQPLGQVVLQLGFASEAQVRYAVKLQQRLAWAPEQAVPMGVRLVTGGVIAPSLLAMLLDERDRTGESLEQLLLQRRLVQPAVLEHFRQQPC